MHITRAFRSFRLSVFRRKEALLAALALLSGVGALIDAIPDAARSLASVVFTL
jgi:hypothetical protein